MRFANVAGRASLVVADGGIVDLEDISRGRFDADPHLAFGRWDELCAWVADGSDVPHSGRRVDEREFGAPSPRPEQIFAVGLNYADHAAETDLALPGNPIVFTKFVSSLSGPVTTVALPSDTVDWEIELVVVIGEGGRDIPAERVWDHVAGMTVGQDLSERTVQWWGPPAQFSLAKSFAGFTPVGPTIVTPGELRAAGHDPLDLALRCELVAPEERREVLQQGRTRQLIFDVPTLIATLSGIVELRPGDLVFTGTPDGVGMGRDPQRYLRAGDVLVSTIEGIGTIRQEFVGGQERT
ncbi:MAG: fumarylacetoacetate hydrolase family protein [Microbacterium sp.]|uniref:fumarylacetoacetate hydrolase family protein n=1 Tax=Microbacterium sp. TaxID=51671 RepID=UPI0039E413C4